MRVCEEKFDVLGWNMSYDICVHNKIINGHHMTVVLRVDDMMISHKIPQEVSIIIEDLKAKYLYNIDKIKVSIGKFHHYLGITLNYIIPGDFNISMTDYVKYMIK